MKKVLFAIGSLLCVSGFVAGCSPEHTECKAEEEGQFYCEDGQLEKCVNDKGDFIWSKLWKCDSGECADDKSCKESEAPKCESDSDIGKTACFEDGTSAHLSTCQKIVNPNNPNETSHAFEPGQTCESNKCAANKKDCAPKDSANGGSGNGGSSTAEKPKCEKAEDLGNKTCEVKTDPVYGDSMAVVAECKEGATPGTYVFEKSEPCMTAKCAEDGMSCDVKCESESDVGRVVCVDVHSGDTVKGMIERCTNDPTMGFFFSTDPNECENGCNEAHDGCK